MKRFFAVFLAAMLLISAFAGCSSEKAPEETGGESPVAIKIGNTEFTVEDVDYMYVTTFNDMYNYYASTYGNYISAIIDITKPLDEQMIDETTSWHQYIVDYTVNSLKSFTGIYEKAIAIINNQEVSNQLITYLFKSVLYGVMFKINPRCRPW